MKDFFTLCECGHQWIAPYYPSHGVLFWASEEPEECPECGSIEFEAVREATGAF